MEPYLLSAAGEIFVTLVQKEGGGLLKPPIIFGMGRNFCMRFTLNGRASKLDFDDVQLVTVFEPENKMAAINQQNV